MKNKDRYNLQELYIKWEENRMIQAWDNNKPIYTSTARSDKILLKYFLEWLEAEYKEPILDEKEKEYLSAVIRPWRDKVKHIYKGNSVSHKDLESICIACNCPFGVLHFVDFPCFKKSTMYKGMELNREYTLEDLGL